MQSALPVSREGACFLSTKGMTGFIISIFQTVFYRKINLYKLLSTLINPIHSLFLPHHSQLPDTPEPVGYNFHGEKTCVEFAAINRVHVNTGREGR